MVTVKIVLPSLQLLCLVCVPSNSLVLVGPDSKAAEEPGVDGGAHQPGEVAADRPRERAKVVEETHVHAHLGQQGKVAEHSPQSPGHTHREHAEAAARHSVPPYTNPHRKPARTAVEHHAHTDKHSQLKRTPKTAERSTPSAAHPHRHAEHSAPSHVPGAPAAGLSTPSPEQQAISADAEPAFPGSSAPHTGLHSLSGSAPTSSQYQMAEYQCASEYATPEYGCKTCNMNRTCSCDGIVKFGYGTDWTNWTDPAQGTIECSSASFGADPKPGRGKVCVCRPRVYMCATEWSRPWANCTQCGEYKTTCDCVGQARFGYGSTWSTWKNVSGTVSCSTSEFGDPVPGQGKVCQCQPLNLYADPPGLTAYEPGHFGGVLKSILAVTLMYFIVYIVLACIRTHNQLKNLEVPSPREKILESAATSCMYFFGAAKADRLEFMDSLPRLLIPERAVCPVRPFAHAGTRRSLSRGKSTEVYITKCISNSSLHISSSAAARDSKLLCLCTCACPPSHTRAIITTTSDVRYAELAPMEGQHAGARDSENGRHCLGCWSAAMR